MNTDTETLINVLNDRLKDMTPEERIETLSAISNGYCGLCGSKDISNNCQCWNDE